MCISFISLFHFNQNIQYCQSAIICSCHRRSRLCFWLGHQVGIRQSSDYLVDRSKVANVLWVPSYFAHFRWSSNLYESPSIDYHRIRYRYYEIPKSLLTPRMPEMKSICFSISRGSSPPHILSTFSIISKL
jgi:hypothetical protein